jgi:hypothetical protein
VSAADCDIKVSYRSADGKVGETDLGRLDALSVIRGSPVREFRWVRGQRHYSGWYWSSTMRGLVVYESRLELSRLMLADFDRSVTGIAAQPFRLAGPDGDRVRRHVPDFLLVTDSGGLTVVDVKVPQRVTEPDVQAQFTWTRRVCALRGWGFEAWSGADESLLSNVRFLAGYRRAALVDAGVVAAVRAACRGTGTIGALEADLACGHPAVLVRPAILHLIWTGDLAADLSRPLGLDSVIRQAA